MNEDLHIRKNLEIAGIIIDTAYSVMEQFELWVHPDKSNIPTEPYVYREPFEMPVETKWKEDCLKVMERLLKNKPKKSDG